MKNKSDLFDIDTDLKKSDKKKSKHILDLEFALDKSKGEFFKEQRQAKEYDFSFEVSKNGTGKIYSNGVINANYHMTNIRFPRQIWEEFSEISTTSITKDIIVLTQFVINEIRSKNIDIIGTLNDKKLYRSDEVFTKAAVEVETRPGSGKVLTTGVITKGTKAENLNHLTNIRFPLETWNDLKEVCRGHITKDFIVLVKFGIELMKKEKIDLYAQFSEKTRRGERE